MKPQIKTIIEEEWKKIRVLFIKHDENWHNGRTYKFENYLTAKYSKIFQFKTIIEKENDDYFIYDEIIESKDKLFFILRLHDNQKRKVWESIIYFENNEVIEQLRCISYYHFASEVKSNKELIKPESKNTTIIRTPFLDFIENTINKKQINNIGVAKKEKYWVIKRLIWKMYHTFIFFLAWGATSIIAKLIVTPLIVSFVSVSVMAWLPYTIAGIVAGICIKYLYLYAKKLKKLMFLNVKDKYQIEIEQKIAVQNSKINSLQVTLQLLKEITFSSQPAVVIKAKFLNCLQTILEINKTKTFKTIKKEIIRKFRKNKKVLAEQLFLKIYVQQIYQWNQNWQENVAFSKYLKSEHIQEIKDIFSKGESNNLPVAAGFFYKPKKTWLQFQEHQKQLINLEKEESQSKWNNVIYNNDISQKSPVKTMKITAL